MPRNASTGIYSKPAGTTAVTGQVIDPTAWNSLTTDIGNELTNSLPRDGSAGMNAQFKATDGTVAAPGMSFGAEVTTGIYRKSAGTMSVAVGGSDILVVNSTGIATPALNGGPISAFRNQIINGDFDIWQRATTQTTSGYGSDDRWTNANVGSTKTHSQQSFVAGQTAVPATGYQGSFSRTVVTSVAGASNFATKFQRIEAGGTLAGKTATVTFYAKADAAKNIAVETIQNFGTGGSPSASVLAIGVFTAALTTAWQKFTYTVAIPSVAGKTFGSNGDSSLQLQFWFDAGSSFNARTNSLGQQSGTFDIAHVSLVEGDATKETDPFSPRHYQQELALCQRYFEAVDGFGLFAFQNAAGSGTWVPVAFKVTKRIVPTMGTISWTGTANATTQTTNNAAKNGFMFALNAASAGNFFMTGCSVNADAEL